MMLKVHKDYPGNLVGEVECFYRVRGDQSIPERLAERIKLTPELIVFKDDRGEITYEQFNRASNRIARVLLDNYRGEKDTVGLLFGHTPSSIITIYGVLKAGKIYVPLDRDYPRSNLEYCIEDSQAKVIITDTNNHDLAQALSPDDGIVINIDDIDPLVSDGNLDLRIPCDAIAAIYYTSGSTGVSKGIIKKHNALLSRPYGLGVGERQAHISSFAFAASITTVYGAVLNGVSIYFYPVKDMGISSLADWLNGNQITILYPPVSLFHQFVETLREEDFFPHLRLVQLAGQRVNVALVDRFRKHISHECLIKHFLASSEAGTSAALFITPEMVLEDEIMPMGYPVIGKKVLILDEDGNQLGPNQVGEIVVKGSRVSGGYWGEAAQGQTKFILDPGDGEEKMVFTGDMGLLRPDGLLEHRGRKDQMVKISGHRVEISLVEASLTKIEGIQEAVVTPREIDSGNKRLVAYVLSNDSFKPRVSDLRKELAQDLPLLMVPTQFIFMDELPRNPSGKIDRSALPEPSQANIARETQYVAPRNNFESQLANIWARILGIQPIGVNDEFFTIGGDSLQAMRIFVEIERTIGKKLPLSLLFQASTVAQQSELLQKKDWVADWSSLVEIQPHGNALPLFCFPGVGGNVLNYHDLSMNLGLDQPCYALQSKGLGMQEEPLARVEDIAEYNIQIIKSVQPEGPYCFCGSSFGGMVAYEIAQQLHALGEEIALVAMFDTHGPNYPKRLPGMTRRKVRFRRRLQNLQKHLVNLRGLSMKGRFRYLRLRAPSLFGRIRLWANNKYQEIRYPLPEDLKKVRKANKKAAQYGYTPPKFGGRLVLFRASHQPYGIIPDPLLGWGEIAGDRIEVFEVEGHHDTLLWEPQVGNVAEVMKTLLSEVPVVQDRKEG